MKKSIKISILCSLLFTKRVFAAEEINVCTDVGVLQTFKIISALLSIIKVLVPVFLIITGIITLTKAVLSSDQDAINNSLSVLITKVIIGVMIFFIPTIMNTVLDMVSYSSEHINLAECISNSKNIDYYKKLDEEKHERKKRELEEKAEKYRQIEEERRSRAEESRRRQAEETRRNYTPSPTPGGSYVGQKYSLSSSDMHFLANVADCEQGTGGAAAELSLIANRFELFGSNYPDITSYTRDSGWFACARNASSSSSNGTIYSYVNDVLVLGHRNLPFYINEHDCINCYGTCSNGNKGDICRIVTDGRETSDMNSIINHNSYIQDHSVLYNRYSSVYTFYTFPCSSCDPFGYTADAINKYNQLNS